MSATASQLINCPTFQAELNSNWANCASIREPLPFLEFMLSPLNRQPIRDMIVSGGKIKTVEVRYDQRISESEVNSNVANPTCSATTKRSDNSATYTIDPNINLNIEEKFDLMDLVRICRSDATFMATTMQKLIDGLMRKVATQTAVEAVALAGGWASDVTGVTNDELVVSTLRAGTTDQVAPFTMEVIETAKMKSGYCAPTGNFGGTTLYQYAKRMMAGCCADQGIDLSKIMDMFGQAFVWDRRVKSALGSEDKTLMVQLGALQLLTFNLFDGMEAGRAFQTPQYTRMVVRDPMTGFPMDFVMTDDCGTVSLNLTATTKVIALPTDMFGVGDVYEGVNYTGVIKVTNS